MFSVIEMCVDYGGVYVFHVCFDLCVVYGVGGCVVVCCLFLASGCCVVMLLEWGDTHFQIFSHNCQFHHRRPESLEHFNVFLKIIYNSEHYGSHFWILRMPYYVTRSPFCVHFHHIFLQVHFACVLCV